MAAVIHSRPRRTVRCVEVDAGIIEADAVVIAMGPVADRSRLAGAASLHCSFSAERSMIYRHPGLSNDNRGSQRRLRAAYE